jgi:HD-GYP domain-containing protein (c-di-GMP phosphodiesterase class II)
MGKEHLKSSQVFNDARTKRGVINALKDLNLRVMDLKKSLVRVKHGDSTLQTFEVRYRKLFETAEIIASLLERREPYKDGHLMRVADLARAMATEMNLTNNRVDGIFVASTIHDFGMVFVSTELLSQKRRLSEAELKIMQGHVQVGYDILKKIPFPWPVARIILEHHERIDGSGYPRGLKGKNLLLDSKILAVADVVDAITSSRPYRPARGIDVALYDIKGNRGTLYDPDVVDACWSLFYEKNYKMLDD